jgi:hypothetical protein
MQDSLQTCSYTSRVLSHSLGLVEPQLDVLWYCILIYAMRAASLTQLYRLLGTSHNDTSMAAHCRTSRVGDSLLLWGLFLGREDMRPGISSLLLLMKQNLSYRV